jgi:uncharacterized protein (DUF58 family)
MNATASSPTGQPQSQPTPHQHDVVWSWWPTQAAASAATVAALALLAAVLIRRAELLVLAAGPLALLAWAPRGTPRGAQVSVSCRPERAGEGDELVLTVQARVSGPVEHLDVSWRPALPLLAPAEPVGQVAVDGDYIEASFLLRPARWGHWDLGQLVVRATAVGRLRQASTAIDAGRCAVYPYLEPMHLLLRPARLPRLTGDHTSAEEGSGVEFAGIRPHEDGDAARLVHARSSARRGRLFVATRQAQRLADVVFIVDAFSDVGKPPHSSLDVAVRAATSLAAGHLRAGYRVAALLLAAGIPWSVPLGLGRGQFTRIVDLMLHARGSATLLEPDLELVPRQVLPPGALVFLASPLLDQRVFKVLDHLRQRGTLCVVLDVLDPRAVQPADSGGHSRLALRLWRLDRTASLNRLRDGGIAVLPAHDAAELATGMAALRGGLITRTRL